MYYEYWGLNRQPFDNVPDPTMYFREHESVEQAVGEVLFAIEEGDDCLAVIVGEVGLGKTTSLRVILDSLDPAKYRIAFVTNPDVTFTMLLRDIIGQLKGQVYPVTRKDDLLEEFNRLLFASADEGKRIVIFIDEGNAFKSANLESLRLLTNMQMDNRNLFTIVLAGQPKLARMLEAPKHANLFQRVGVYCRLEKMPSWEVVRDYIDHRLERAGAAKRVFTDEAVKAMFEYSENGVPRLVNKIAKLALKAGETNGLKEIGPDMVAGIGERFKRFMAKPGRKDDGAEEAPAAAAARPEELVMPIEPDEASEAAPAAPAVQAAPVEAPVETPSQDQAVPEPLVERFAPLEMPVDETPDAVDQRLSLAAPSASEEAYAGIRHQEPVTSPVAETKSVADGDSGGGADAGQPLVSPTQVCLDEVLRPEILQRARAADKTERIKMAGQLAAEEIKKHPEVISGAGDPVVMWKELRNEILSAFAAEVNS